MEIPYILGGPKLDNPWRASLALSNSWDPGDGLASFASVYGPTETDAIELVCKVVMIELLLRDGRDNSPNWRMRLVPNNWLI
jgi:hypothetical protein